MKTTPNPPLQPTRLRLAADRNNVMRRRHTTVPAIVVLCLAVSVGCGRPPKDAFAKEGGSARVRVPFEAVEDDPFTSNDESNDQPVGHFGTLTMAVSSYESGNTYTLDVELDGTEVERIYFPKGGWVDFYSCDLDEALEGHCWDENGREWTFEGDSSGWSLSRVDDSDVYGEDESAFDDGDKWQDEEESDDEDGYDEDNYDY